MYDNLCNFIHDELGELDRKAKASGKLSASEIEYGDKLAHLKKSLLTAEAMDGASDGYSGAYDMRTPYRYDRPGMMYGGAGSSYRGYSRARDMRADGSNRYSAASDSIEDIKQEMQQLMARVDKM